jgi:hypothetical protein
MHYLFEAIIVGIYSSVIFIFFRKILREPFLIIFFTGFAKHFFGYFSGLHTYYCNEGHAGSKKKYSTKFAEIPTENLVGQSIFEGAAFLLLNGLLIESINNSIIRIFLVGVSLHIGAEFSGIHRHFCEACVESKSKIIQ